MAPQPLTAVFLFSLCILPLSIWLGFTLSLYLKLRPYAIKNWPSNPQAIRKRVLLTGDDDQAILSTARVLHASGSTVYVVKHERIPYLNFLRTSKAVAQYIGLASGRLTPILRRLKERGFHLAAAFNVKLDIGIPMNFPGTTLRLIESENIDLWIHCDAARPSIAQAQARDIVLKHSAAKILGPDMEIARLGRSYAAFAHYVKHNETAVRCPKTAVVRARAEIHELLGKTESGHRFLLERSVAPAQETVKANSSTKRDSSYDDTSTLVNDSSDTDDFEDLETSTPVQEYVLLPQSTPNETYSTVASLRISKQSPWTMHEIIEGKPGTISTLVVHGKVKAFAARTATQARTFSTAAKRSPSPRRAKLNVEHDVKEWQQHEQTTFVDPKSTIGTALLQYAKRFAASLPEKPSTYMNLHFFLTDRTTVDGAEQKIVATGCDFNFSPVLAQQALVGEAEEDFGAALTAAPGSQSGTILLPTDEQTEQSFTQESYSFPSLALHTLAYPMQQVLQLKAPLADSSKVLASFFSALAYGQELMFDWKDLAPWVWFWSVQTPVEIAFEGLVEILEIAQMAVATGT